MKVLILWCFLSLGVSAEVSVATAASEQYMVHVALVSWGLFARYRGQWLLLVLLDLSKQPLVFLNKVE